MTRTRIRPLQWTTTAQALGRRLCLVWMLLLLVLPQTWVVVTARLFHHQPHGTAASPATAAGNQQHNKNNNRGHKRRRRRSSHSRLIVHVRHELLVEAPLVLFCFVEKKQYRTLSCLPPPPPPPPPLPLLSHTRTNTHSQSSHSSFLEYWAFFVPSFFCESNHFPPQCSTYRYRNRSMTTRTTTTTTTTTIVWGVNTIINRPCLVCNPKACP